MKKSFVLKCLCLVFILKFGAGANLNCTANRDPLMPLLNRHKRYLLFPSGSAVLVSSWLWHHCLWHTVSVLCILFSVSPVQCTMFVSKALATRFPRGVLIITEFDFFYPLPTKVADWQFKTPPPVPLHLRNSTSTDNDVEQSRPGEIRVPPLSNGYRPPQQWHQKSNSEYVEEYFVLFVFSSDRLLSSSFSRSTKRITITGRKTINRNSINIGNKRKQRIHMETTRNRIIIVCHSTIGTGKCHWDRTQNFGTRNKDSQYDLVSKNNSDSSTLKSIAIGSITMGTNIDGIFLHNLRVLLRCKYVYNLASASNNAFTSIYGIYKYELGWVQNVLKILFRHF